MNKATTIYSYLITVIINFIILTLRTDVSINDNATSFILILINSTLGFYIVYRIVKRVRR